MMKRPKIAVIDPNTLALIGMRQLIGEVMPMAEVDIYCSFAEMALHDPQQYFHYFVDVSVVLAERPFFLNQRHKTIVMTTMTDADNHLTDFRTLCTGVGEKQLVRQLLALSQVGHAHGRNLPPMPPGHAASAKKTLSDREVEVLSLLAQGKMNKEIAAQLNIGLTTVISHRKNIIDKLGIKSVSALTIYAVTHGYVDISSI